MARPTRQPEASCPFLERDDPRCARRFTLSHLEEAFDYCLSRYTECPSYHQLQQEAPGGEPESLPQPITIFGRRVERFVRDARPAPAPIPLRQTGT